MKSWKKTLLGIVAVLTVIGAVAGYSLYRVEQDLSERLTADMQEYIKATPEIQDQYILTSIDDLLNRIPGTESWHHSLPTALKKDPELRKAALAWGRSFCASVVVADENLYEKLTPEAKQKYQKEASEMESRGKNFKELIDKHDQK